MGRGHVQCILEEQKSKKSDTVKEETTRWRRRRARARVKANNRDVATQKNLNPEFRKLFCKKLVFRGNLIETFENPQRC